MKKDLRDLKIASLQQQLVKQRLRDLARDSISEFVVTKNGKLKKLTDQMIGFNYGIKCIAENMDRAEKWYDFLSDHSKEALNYLVLEKVIDIEVTPDEITTWMTLEEDTFSDGEQVQDVKLHELPMLVQLHEKFGKAGILAFVSHHRGIHPIHPLPSHAEAIAWIGRHG
jgi:hypothetical protein